MMTDPTPQTPAIIAEAERLLKDITPGEWGVEDPHHEYLSVIANPRAPTYEWIEVALVPEEPEDGITKSQQEANARFIAAAPRLVRALSSADSRSQQMRDALEKLIAEMRTVLTVAANSQNVPYGLSYAYAEGWLDQLSTVLHGAQPDEKEQKETENVSRGEPLT